MHEKRIRELVDSLQLKPHPEGGYYREVYRSVEIIPKNELPLRYSGDCNFSTSIYYLLAHNDFSAFHRIKSDEIWHFYEGQTLIIYVIHQDGRMEIKKLGKNLHPGDAFQHVIPAGAWFAVRLADQAGYALAGCTVAPGFNFSDFELARKEEIINQYPQHKSLFSELCRD